MNVHHRDWVEKASSRNTTICPIRPLRRRSEFCYGMPLSNCVLRNYQLSKIGGLLGLRYGDRCHKQIKQITISQGTLLAFRYKRDGDFEK